MTTKVEEIDETLHKYEYDVEDLEFLVKEQNDAKKKSSLIEKKDKLLKKWIEYYEDIEGELPDETRSKHGKWIAQRGIDIKFYAKRIPRTGLEATEEVLNLKGPTQIWLLVILFICVALSLVGVGIGLYFLISIIFCIKIKSAKGFLWPYYALKNAFSDMD